MRTRPVIMYGSCKVHRKCVHGCPPFILDLSALQTPATYKLAKFLVPILEPLTTNKYTIKKNCLTLLLKLLSKIPVALWVA